MKLSRIIFVALFLLIAVVCLAQRYGGGRWRFRGDSNSAREELPDAPTWTNRAGFEKDVFTFVRIKYDSTSRRSRSGGNWHIDVPESDLNLSYRLQQVTSLKVNPDGRFLRLTDPELF
ncbi:MAG: hypothetical protein QOD03_620, partial [Verrucomicrobiota bacterium]